MLQKLKVWWNSTKIVLYRDIWRKSWVKIWGWMKIIVGALLISLHTIVNQAGDLITEPTVKSALDAMNFPAYVGLGLAIIGVITLTARSHRA